MTSKWLRRSWAPALLALGSLFVIAAVACGGSSSATPTASSQPTATAMAATPTTAPTAMAATATTTSSGSNPTATSAPTQATATQAPSTGGQHGDIVIPVVQIFPINGEPYLGTYDATEPLGVTDPLFGYNADTGDPMQPYLADSWSVSTDGLKLTMTIKKNIPWNAPYDAPEASSWLGTVTAQDVVDYLNTCNAKVNPDGTCGDAGDYGAYGGEAVAVDQYTIEQPLWSPIYFCTPYSEFGCLSAARNVNLTTREVDKMGAAWSMAHLIGTGPFITGGCKEGDRCTSYALPSHWKKAASISSVTQLQVPEANTRLAMLKNGQADIAAADFKLVPGIMADYNAGKSNVRFMTTVPGEYIGASILFPGNLWEKTHPVTGEALNPWDSPALAKDYAWIGDPWQQAEPSMVKYTDTNNPAGMTDMEQARLVRLALSIAVSRDDINNNLLGGLGLPLYCECMGPAYPGWDPNANTGVWDWEGNKINASGTQQPMNWKLADGNLTLAGQLLDEAGFPADSSGNRPGFGDFNLNVYSPEIGQVALTMDDYIVSQWSKLGLNVSELNEAYGAVVSPRMRKREQYWPVVKNGDINSNLEPLTWPLPPVNSALSRPGWGVGFETDMTAKTTLAIFAEKDAAKAKQLHIDNVNYEMYWNLYPGATQVPVGLLATARVKSWNQPAGHYISQANLWHPEDIVLN